MAFQLCFMMIIYACLLSLVLPSLQEEELQARCVEYDRECRIALKKRLSNLFTFGYCNKNWKDYYRSVAFTEDDLIMKADNKALIDQHIQENAERLEKQNEAEHETVCPFHCKSARLTTMLFLTCTEKWHMPIISDL
jgi:hypothetical protein